MKVHPILSAAQWCAALLGGRNTQTGPRHRCLASVAVWRSPPAWMMFAGYSLLCVLSRGSGDGASRKEKAPLAGGADLVQQPQWQRFSQW